MLGVSADANISRDFTWSDWLQESNEELELALNGLLKHPRPLVVKNFNLIRKNDLPRLMVDIQVVPILLNEEVSSQIVYAFVLCYFLCL